jgi:hypothetical protein
MSFAHRMIIAVPTVEIAGSIIFMESSMPFFGDVI